MRRSLVVLLVLLTVLRASARENESWTEVRTPHFVVLTDSNEKDGRRVADQFERMRAVFHNVFPRATVDFPSPIVVLALKNKKGFQALEPTAYLAKGQIELAGLFLRAPEKNFVLLRMDAGGDHPYATVYHEYTHLLLSADDDWLPLWMNEGMAEFFQNTEIRDKDVLLGQPSADNLEYLRQNRLLPIATLLTVDHNSPYYHDEQKGSVFYAESWALVHYLQVSDQKAHTRRLVDYGERLSKHEEPLAAAEHAFGDLKQLQKALESYVSQASFTYFKAPSVNTVDESTFQVRVVSGTEADAVRADFLAYNDREKDARALLDGVLKTDPNNVLAHETMGLLAFRAGNLDEAGKWYEKAVKLDSQSYLAQYYFAAITMREGTLDDARAAQVEASLRATIKLNPRFADAYDRLAVLYGERGEKLEEAHQLSLRAVDLDPANVTYRRNTASILIAMHREQDALAVLKRTLRFAKTPEDMASVQSQIKELEQFEQQSRQMAEAGTQAPAQPTIQTTPETTAQGTVVMGPAGAITTGAVAGSNNAVGSAAPRYPSGPATGPKHTLRGVLRGVQCSAPALMELKVVGTAKTVSLYSNNFYKVEFSAANFTPKGDMNPCTTIEGMKALVEYAETADKSIGGQVLTIELIK